MEQAHTSDTLDIDFLKSQKSYILSPQTISKIYSCQQQQLLLQNIMSMANMDKPLILYQLLEQMENQHTKVLLKKGEIHPSQLSYQNKSYQRQSQECIGVSSQKQNRNTHSLLEIKNIYQQHSYHTHILPILSGFYSQQVEIQGQSQRKQQLKGLQYLGKHSLGGNSDHLLSNKKQRQIQKEIEIEENFNNNRNNKNDNTNNNTNKNNNINIFSQQLQIVSQSVNSVQCLLTKISLLRKHSVLIREKIKQKKFNIDKLHIIKNNKKQYLTHLMNVQTIIRNKILPLSITMDSVNSLLSITMNSVNSLCSQHAIDNNNTEYNHSIEQQKLLLVQQLIMKYQYSPYVFLNKTLHNKLYDIICYRIQNKLQVRLMNLTGNKLMQLLQVYLPKLIVSIGRLQQRHDKRQGNIKRRNQHQQQQQQQQRQTSMTLTQLTKNLLKIVIYLKPDSYQCTDTNSSAYLHSQYQELLQQSYITASLNNDLTSFIQVDEFIKVGSMMQFSPTTRQIYASLKYTWLSLYKLGVKHTLSVFSTILVQQQQTICQQSLSLPKEDRNNLFKQNNDSDRKVKTITLSTNINLNERYGKIGYTLQSVSQLIKRFQPKYNWVYQYIVSKNVSLKKCLSKQFESLGLYLVDSLFKIVDKYQKDTQNRMFKRLVCQKVFGRSDKNRNKKIIRNVSQQSLEIIQTNIQQSNKNEFIDIVKKAIQLKQIQKHNNDNKSNKEKKKQQQKSKLKKKQSYKQINKNKKEKNDNKQSVFMVIDDDYDNDEQLLSVQFEIIQKTEMKKMLIFQSQTLRGLSQDNRMEVTQREIVHMIQRVNVLGCGSKGINININECDNNRDNDNNQVDKKMNKRMSRQQLSSTPPRSSILNNNEIYLANANNEIYLANANNESVKAINQMIQIYQSYGQECYQTDEVKQFQTVLLKLIMQELIENDENNKDQGKDNHTVKLLRYSNRLEQINNKIKANQSRINTLKLILTNTNCQHKNYSHNHNHTLIINQINQLQQQVITYHTYCQNQKLQKQKQLLSVQKNKQSPKKKKSLFGSNKDNHKDSNKDNHNSNGKKKELIMQDTIIETQNKYKQSTILLLTKIKTTLAACVHSLIAIIKEQKIKQQKERDRVNSSYQERVFISSVIIKLLAIVEIIQSLCYTQCNSNKKQNDKNDNKHSKSPQYTNKPLYDNNNNTDNYRLMLTSKNQLLSKQEITNDLLIPINENDLNKIISFIREQYQSTSSQSSSQLFRQLFYGVSNMVNNTFSIDYNGVDSNMRGVKSESNLLTYQYQSTQYRNNSFTQLQRNNSFTQLQKQLTNTNTKSKQAINTPITKTKKESKISSFIGSVFGKLNKKKSTQQNHDTIIQQQQRQQLKEDQTKSKKQQQQPLQKVQNKRKSSLQEQLSSVSLQNLYQSQKASVNNNNNQNNNNMNRQLHKQSKQIQLKTLLMLIYQMIRK